MREPFSRGIAWYKYESLESDFIESTDYFPFEKKHKDIWSEHFSDLIVKVGNSIDSFFRLMLKDKSFDSCPHVVSLKETDRKRDISFFRDFFEPIYQLSSVEVSIAYGLTFYERKSCPFKEFGKGENPDWWTSYNHVKHEWFDCLKEATLEKTIRALAGLFILNILHKESQRYLIRHTDVFYAQYMEKSEMEHQLMQSLIGVPKALQNWEVIAETPLFTHVLRVDKSVEGNGLVLSDEDS